MNTKEIGDQMYLLLKGFGVWESRSIQACKQLIRNILFDIKDKEMNIMNADLQIGITYTLNPTLYFNPQSLLLPNHFITQNIPNQRDFNLETSFQLLHQKYQALLHENEELKNKLDSLTPKPQASTNKRKFIRRKEDELDKKFKCCFDHCKKQYASTLALNLHIKNKHKGGTKKQMDDQAKKIIEAQLKGEDLPNEAIKLPEGYLEMYRRTHLTLPSSTDEQSSSYQ